MSDINTTDDEFDKFDTTVKTLSKVLEVHREELNKTKNVAKTAVIVGIIGLMVGFLGIFVGFDGRTVARNTESARREARISSCIQANVSTKGAKEAITSSILAFAKDPTNLTPQEQLIFDAYMKRVDEKLPYRDCSPAGLDEYYNNPPVDPAK